MKKVTIRRGLAFILILTIAFCVALPVQADNQTDASPDDFDMSLDSAPAGDYAKYLAENSNFLGEGEAFTLSAREYTSRDSMELIVGEGLQLKSEGGSVSWDVNVAVSGMYNLEIEYKPLGDSADSVEFAIAIDGQRNLG